MGYTNSSLVSHTRLSPNHSGQRTHSIDRITPHCVVGQVTAESLGEWFAQSSSKVSSNYGIDKTGRVGMYVAEKNRSWCSSSNANDQRAITIECASDTKEPYAMNAAVYETLIKLCVDICKRYNKKKLLWFGDKTKTLSYEPKSDEMVITVHRWFASKSCPGDWLYSRLGDLATKVTAQLVSATANVSTSTNATKSISSAPTNSLKYEKGKIVNFIGTKHYASSNSTNAATCKPGVSKITAIAIGAKHPYHLIAEKDGGSNVYGWVDENTISSYYNAFTPYKVKVTATSLNIRKGAGTNYAITGRITDKGIYTIVGEANGVGATRWLKLKSGIGFISSDYTKKV